MWRYLEGAKPPPSKKPKTEEKKKVSAREYEIERRKRRWNEKWKTESNREWLQYDVERDHMFCHDCRIHASGEKRGPFVVGTQNFKLESIMEHEKSQAHMKCARIASAKKAPPNTSIAEKTLSSLNRAQSEKMDKLFRTAHAIAKKGRPFTDYVWMCDLDEMKGIDIGKTYRNHTQVRCFVAHIAAVERSHIHNQFADARFFSLLSDGSTDSAVIEEEIVYARYAKEGVVFTQFLRLQSVDKADAQHIASAITKAASSGLGVEEEVWRGRLVGVGSDGAAVMVGRKSGVVTRLSDGLPHVLGVHCMAHRLELSFKDVAKKNLCHKKLDTLLLGLYYFYHNSPLNRANLKASYQSLQKSPLMPTRVGGTRWVSHILKALDHFVRGYAPIVQHLSKFSLLTL